MWELAELEDGPFSAGINVRQNRIEIEVVSLEAFRAWATRTGFAMPRTAHLKVVSALEQRTADIYGGLPLDGGDSSTSGFGVVNSSGTRGVTTAGHAANWKTYQGVDLPFQAESFGGWYDVQWHTAPGFTVRNLITDVNNPPTYTRPITSRTLRGNQTVGGLVCKYGRSSGYGCGTLLQKDHIPVCIPDARPVWMRTDISSSGGDSGGPVFLNESAFGTMSCGSSTTTIYSAVDFVEGGVGVTILTN